jgi:uncharacterized membrane protein YeiB
MVARYPLASRLVVPDVLRGFAILAMLVAHASPLSPINSGVVGLAISSLNDVASPLFALVMGISAAIVVRRTPTDARARWILIAQNTARGLILILLGLWLSTWGSWIAIVLAPLGLTLMVGTPIVLLRSRWVALVMAVVAIASAPLVAAVTTATFAGTAVTNPVEQFLVQNLFTDPHYRVMNLLPFFLAGALLLRHGFKRDWLVWVLLGAAVLAYPLRPIWTRVTNGPVSSGSYPDTLHDIGLVLFVYAMVVVLASVKVAWLRSTVAIVFTPLRVIGTLALSIYVLQVAVIALIAQQYGLLYPLSTGVSLLLMAVIVIGVPALGAVWWYFLGDGPVERLIRVVTRRRRAVTPAEP